MAKLAKCTKYLVTSVLAEKSYRPCTPKERPTGWVCVRDEDILFLLHMLYSSFFSSYSTFSPKFAFVSPFEIQARLTRGNFNIQCAKLCQFAVDYFSIIQVENRSVWIYVKTLHTAVACSAASPVRLGGSLNTLTSHHLVAPLPTQTKLFFFKNSRILS